MLRNNVPQKSLLLVHGSEDPICPAGASGYMADWLPEASLEVLEGAGHAPMLTRAGEIHRIIDAFLDRIYEFH